LFVSLIKKPTHLSHTSDDTFKEFVLDQLGALPELRARAVK
jgi:hypothetical protein